MVTIVIFVNTDHIQLTEGQQKYAIFFKLKKLLMKQVLDKVTHDTRYQDTETVTKLCHGTRYTDSSSDML